MHLGNEHSFDELGVEISLENVDNLPRALKSRTLKDLISTSVKQRIYWHKLCHEKEVVLNEQNNTIRQQMHNSRRERQQMERDHKVLSYFCRSQFF